MSKIKSLATILSVLIMSFFVGYLVLAWTEPTNVPPGGNVSPPLNISSIGQYKSGGLTAGASLTPPAAAFYAPAFYDSDELAYFVDPNGPLSNLKGKLQIGNITTGSTTDYLCPSSSGEIQKCSGSPGGGGGGTYTYWEIKSTTATYNGDMGGWKGLAEKCTAEFPNSIPYDKEIMVNAFNGGPATKFVPASAGWFGTRNELYTPSTNFEGPCFGWTSSDALNAGSTIEPDGGEGSVMCNLPYPVTCAIPIF